MLSGRRGVPVPEEEEEPPKEELRENTYKMIEKRNPRTVTKGPPKPTMTYDWSQDAWVPVRKEPVLDLKTIQMRRKDTNKKRYESMKNDSSMKLTGTMTF